MTKSNLVKLLNNSSFTFVTGSFMARNVMYDLEVKSVLSWLADKADNDFIECFYLESKKIYIGASD